MGKIIPVLAIIVIIGGFYFVASSNDKLDQTLQEDFTAAKQLVHKFGNSGEEIIFYIDPQPPITEWSYNEIQVEERFYNNDTGKVETRTVTEIEKVPTSVVLVESYDRQTADTKVCKRGNQCDITGEITLIDPNTGLEIAPPYGFFIEIKCQTTSDPILNCGNFSTRTFNDLTYADKSFKYTFTTTQNDPTGDYRATVSVASKFKIVDPLTGFESVERRDGTISVKITP